MDFITIEMQIAGADLILTIKLLTPRLHRLFQNHLVKHHYAQSAHVARVKIIATLLHWRFRLRAH